MHDRDRDLAVQSRGDVLDGSLGGAELLRRLRSVPLSERDAWLDILLALPALPDDADRLPAGCVPYLPCPVDVVVAALQGAQVQREDVFVDLGAGLGRAVLLARLLCGARAFGVELQPGLVAQAQQAAAGLGLHDVLFVCGDAASADLDAGSVFFIYASFGLATLRRVLGRLQPIAAQRPIRLCAVDFDVPTAEFPWLRPRASTRCELMLYDSLA